MERRFVVVVVVATQEEADRIGLDAVNQGAICSTSAAVEGDPEGDSGETRAIVTQDNEEMLNVGIFEEGSW